MQLQSQQKTNRNKNVGGTLRAQYSWMLDAFNSKEHFVKCDDGWRQKQKKQYALR